MCRLLCNRTNQRSLTFLLRNNRIVIEKDNNSIFLVKNKKGRIFKNKK